MPNPTIDFFVSNMGTIWRFFPQTPNALAFAQHDLGLEPWQWLGETFNVEHRIGPELLRAIVEEGWVCAPFPQ